MISCVCHTQDINATYILVCNTFAVLASRKPNAGASELMMQIVHWLPALDAYHFSCSLSRVRPSFVREEKKEEKNGSA